MAIRQGPEASDGRGALRISSRGCSRTSDATQKAVRWVGQTHFRCSSDSRLQVMSPALAYLLQLMLTNKRCLLEGHEGSCGSCVILGIKEVADDLMHVKARGSIQVAVG
jgi:hypothetical protein